MIKFIAKFALLTVGIAIAGIMLLAISISASDQPEQLGAVAVIGTLVFFFSPLLSGLWIWLSTKGQRSKAEARLQETELEQLEEKKNFQRRLFLERQRLLDSVDKHRTTLERNLQRALKRNDYGILIEDNTQGALGEFFASIDLDLGVIEENEAGELVFEQLGFRKELDKEAGFDSTSIPFDGHAFEKWVADALEGFGWKASVTSGSGDQGIDVLAERDGRKIGLQCKLYSNAIGNKAIQEAHAGKAYYGVDEVGVLTNAQFTSSARDLALATGVHLLSHHDIPKLHELVFE